MASTAPPEERFARKLASNDLPVRTKALKRLTKWIQSRSALEDGFTEMELLKLWKGLHVCMWHSDKPLVQEELAERLASLVYNFEVPERGLEFVAAFFITMAREWLGIDRLRLDKYYMLIRRMVRHTLKFLQQFQWNQELMAQFLALLSEGPLCKDSVKACLGVQLHVIEVLLPELLSLVDTPTDHHSKRKERCPVEEILAPLFSLQAQTTNSSVIQCLESSVLTPLETNEIIEKLKLDRGVVSEMLQDLAIDRSTVGRNRKRLYDLYERFSQEREQSSQPPTKMMLKTVRQLYPQATPLHLPDPTQPPPQKRSRKAKRITKMKTLLKKRKKKSL